MKQKKREKFSFAMKIFIEIQCISIGFDGSYVPHFYYPMFSLIALDSRSMMMAAKQPMVGVE